MINFESTAIRISKNDLHVDVHFNWRDDYMTLTQFVLLFNTCTVVVVGIVVFDVVVL